MKQRKRQTNNQLCSPWFLFVFTCYYVPFWGGTFWFFSRLPPDYVIPTTTLFDWIAFFGVLLLWLGAGLGGIVVAIFFGEVLKRVVGRKHRKEHFQIDREDRYLSDEFDDSWYMLDSEDELLDAQFVDSSLIVQEGFEELAFSTIAVDEEKSDVKELFSDEVGVVGVV